MSNETQSNAMTTEAITRIARDVRDIMREPIDNIFYIHSTRSINRGYAIVIGTSETPYFCVPMCYKLKFPTDYPHMPPKMKFLSYSSPNNKSIRMHPNYYVNGKCCLSILNSWSGDQWTGCQTIRSVLTTILMTLTENPLENEPGHRKGTLESDTYRAIVAEAGLELIANYLTGASPIRFCKNDEENNEVNEKFRELIFDNIVKHNDYGRKLFDVLNSSKTKNYIYKWIKPFDLNEHYIACYRLTCKINYEKTRTKIIDVLKPFMEISDEPNS